MNPTVKYGIEFLPFKDIFQFFVYRVSGIVLPTGNYGEDLSIIFAAAYIAQRKVPMRCRAANPGPIFNR